MDHRATVEAALSKREMNSLVRLQQKANAAVTPTVRVTDAQRAAMKKAFAAVLASGAEVSDTERLVAQRLGLI